MKNVKLFFSSLVSNNSAIDGARKKPWYAAIVFFFISILLSVIPTTVLELNKQGQKNFEPYNYGLAEATHNFSKELQKDEYKDKMYVIKQGKESTLVGYETLDYKTSIRTNTSLVTFRFIGVAKDKYDAKYLELNKTKDSYVLFTSDAVHIRLVNPNETKNTVVEMGCINAYKKIEKEGFKKAYVAGADPSKSWENWKILVKNLYNQTRLRNAGLQLAIVSAINAGISLIMGFMLWILTRGKNNPYRLFTVWECFAISFWAGISPAILTCGLGFLIKNFASMMFPLLLGVRVMWLSMKSLRPDGSGYAAE